MRIIAGRARGQRLEVPAGRHVRPTLGRTREALFSMLASRLGDFDDLHVLDLCAGSGGLGLEAWSRGAAHVTLVEHNRRTARLIADNARRIGATDAVRVVDGRLPRALSALGSARYDLVFFDPPYDQHALYPETLRALVTGDRLAVDAVVCVEHDARRAPDIPDDLGFETLASRTHGATGITILGWHLDGDGDEPTS